MRMMTCWWEYWCRHWNTWGDDGTCVGDDYKYIGGDAGAFWGGGDDDAGNGNVDVLNHKTAIHVGASDCDVEADVELVVDDGVDNVVNDDYFVNNNDVIHVGIDNDAELYYDDTTVGDGLTILKVMKLYSLMMQI